MFDLEQQVQQWRRTVADALGGRPEVVAELESHLRDEVERLVQSGKPPEDAWRTALARLGSPTQLAAEFGKLPPPGPASWLPARFILAALAVLALGLAWFLVAQLRQGRIGPLLAGHVFTITAGYTVTLAIGLLAAWVILARAVRGPDVWRAQALRSAARVLTATGLGLTAVGVVLGSWWARDHLGRAWGWDSREIGGLSVLAWYSLMLACLLRSRSAELTSLLLGLAGNVVVSLSWFGPVLEVERHFHGWPPVYIGWLLLGFVLMQLLLLGIALLPAGRLARRRA